MLEELREQSFVFAESYDAIADVAGREHVEFFAQASAGASVIANRDYGAEIADDWRSGACCWQLSRSEREAFESLEQSGETRASADGDNPKTTLAGGLLRRRESAVLVSIEGSSIAGPANTIRLRGRNFPAKPGRLRDLDTTAP